MYRLQHFVAKHSILCKVISIIVWAFMWIVLLCGRLNFNIIAGMLCYIICIFSYLLIIDATPSLIMQKTMHPLNNKCDPYPLLLETEKLLTYKNSKSAEQLILMNRAVALSDIGRYQEAYDIQKSVNIDKNPAPINRCIYYNNLFQFCMNLEKFDEAGIWFEKLMQVYADVKGKKALAMLESSIISSKAAEAYRKGDYMASIELTNSNTPKNLRSRVSGAMDYARACIALGENEKAADALAIVIRNGNRLYCVNEAAAMLRKIKGIEE